jgi:hypothetical protein
VNYRGKLEFVWLALAVAGMWFRTRRVVTGRPSYGSAEARTASEPTPVNAVGVRRGLDRDWRLDAALDEAFRSLAVEMGSYDGGDPRKN